MPLGKGTIIAASLLLLGLLTVFFFQGRLEEQRNRNHNPASAVTAHAARQVILARNRQGHYRAGGRLNDAPVQFLIDTGAKHLGVSEEDARSWGLHFDSPILVSTASGTVVAHQTNIDRVALGEIVLNDIRAAIVPGLPPGEILLGMSLPKHLEMFQRGDVLIIRQSDVAM